MSHLTEIIEVLQDINSIQEKINPLQRELNEKRKVLNKLNEDLDVNPFLHNFICLKLIEDFTEKELQKLSEYREYVKSNAEGPSVYYNSELVKVFDPQFDDWYIYDYNEDKETGKIRLAVSCKKNEGSISGLMTFLDTHYTSWFNPKEFEELD